MARPLDQPDRTARAKPFGGSDANRFPTFELGNRASLLQATIGGVSRCVALVGIHPLPPYWPADGRASSFTPPEPLPFGSPASSLGRRSPPAAFRAPGLFENNHVALAGHGFDWLANRNANQTGALISILPSLSILLSNRDPPAFPVRSKTTTWLLPATVSIGWPIATPIELVC